MILSASRRTDIPNYYSEWFFYRIKAGFLYVRNPMNVRQISRIDVSPDVIDCIVFWTKNPEPMLARLDELAAYHYYFQFTLTGYGKDLEPNVPHKKDRMISVFQKLSDRTSKKQVVWRYDPILFTETYTPAYHLKAFTQIAEALEGFTDKCVISFVDMYAKNRKTLQTLKIYEPPKTQLLEFCSQIVQIAGAHGIKVASCAETMDLSGCGIEHNACIDKHLIEELIGCTIKVRKDRNQRSECGCVESVEIGTYDTCSNGCQYCYANDSLEKVRRNRAMYDPLSPLLCGTVGAQDKITVREMKLLGDGQMSFCEVR